MKLISVLLAELDTIWIIIHAKSVLKNVVVARILRPVKYVIPKEKVDRMKLMKIVAVWKGFTKMVIVLIVYNAL